MAAEAGAEELRAFDYEDASRIEGRGDLDPSRRDLSALRLVRALEILPRDVGRILEVGCGAGRYIRFFRGMYQAACIVGCDISFTAIREAAGAGGGRFLVADATRLPFEDACFDLVLAFDVFEHLHRPEVAAEECRRVLRPGGLLHSFVPCECNPRTLFRLLKGSRLVPIHEWKFRQVGHVQCFTEVQVRELFEGQGLHIAALSYSFHPLGQIYDILDYWRREKVEGASPAGKTLINLVTKPLLSPLWRLAFYEAQWLRSRPWAVGLHITAKVPEA